MLKELVKEFDIDYSHCLPTEIDIQTATEFLGIKFGKQLCEYLHEYGYLGCASIEFYGLNSKQKLSSDLVSQTQYLHKYFPATQNLIAFENCGEGDYVLLNESDDVFLYVSELEILKDLNTTLFDYIVERFKNAF